MNEIQTLIKFREHLKLYISLKKKNEVLRVKALGRSSNNHISKEITKNCIEIDKLFLSLKALCLECGFVVQDDFFGVDEPQ